jgi:putative endonuclease
VSGTTVPDPRRGDPRRLRGQRAEQLAAELLEGQGMRILARNWRQPGGELDLVADDGGTCVFVEVRSRTGLEFGHPLEAISPQKRGQVVRAARLYLDNEAPAASGYRFDVIGVLFDPHDPEAATCFHVPNAFDVQG